MALSFLFFQVFYFILFHFILVSSGSKLFVYLAVSSHFIYFFPSLSFCLLLLQTNHFEGDYPVRKKAGAKKEYRMKNSVTSLPLLHSVYFVPGLSLFFIFFYFSLSFMSFRLPSSLYLFFCFVRVYLFIYLAHSQQLTQTQHTTTALNDL